MAEKGDEVEQKGGSVNLRAVAFCAIVLSTVAITACLVSFPMIFHYVRALEVAVQGEIDYCKLRTKDMWRDTVDENENSYGEDYNDGLEVLLRASRQISSCCACQQGSPGAVGPPGADGKPGSDGKSGAPGDAGKDANKDDKVAPIPDQCACKGAVGPAGLNGPKGPPGPPGQPGKDGADGDKGPDGPIGPSGVKGPDGKAGPKGEPGPDGPILPSAQLPAGPLGPPGKDGPAGTAGETGKPGSPGPDGKPGEPGPTGPPGKDGVVGKDGATGKSGPPGPKGSCEHCPPARLAPGY